MHLSIMAQQMFNDAITQKEVKRGEYRPRPFFAGPCFRLYTSVLFFWPMLFYLTGRRRCDREMSRNQLGSQNLEVNDRPQTRDWVQMHFGEQHSGRCFVAIFQRRLVLPMLSLNRFIQVIGCCFISSSNFLKTPMPQQVKQHLEAIIIRTFYYFVL